MRLLVTYLLITALTGLGILHALDADDLLPAPLRYSTWREALDFPSAPDAVKTSTSTPTEGAR